MKRASLSLACLFVWAGVILASAATDPQSGSSATSGTVRGVVTDPSSAAIPGATVILQNPVSHYNQSATTDAEGKFEFKNVPYNNYHLTILSGGFSAAEKDVEVRSPVPVDAGVTLQLGGAKTSVVVSAEAADLVEANS